MGLNRPCCLSAAAAFSRPLPAVSEPAPPTVFCFGEILWDCLPQGLFLGGAPYNVACHLARLGTEPYLLSTIGSDVLGMEALERAATCGVNTRFMSHTHELPTGTVKVRFPQKGLPAYRIRRGVAWDNIVLPEALFPELRHAGALVFGSLAQRSEDNVEALERLLAVEGPKAVFDVNLRAPFDALERVHELCTRADLVKVNEEELFRLLGEESEDRARLEEAVHELATRYTIPMLCVTLGADGALLRLADGEVLRGRGEPVEVADTVGAGDAFLACLISGLVNGLLFEEENYLDRCCRLGAFVASRLGATPDYRAEDVFGGDWQATTLHG